MLKKTENILVRLNFALRERPACRAGLTKSNGRRDNGMFVAQSRVRYATKGKRQKLYTKSSVARHKKKCQTL